MDILNNDFITYDCIRASVNISQEEQEAYAVMNGDILFQRSSETIEDVGRANVYIDDKPAVFGGFIIRGKKKMEYDPIFFLNICWQVLMLDGELFQWGRVLSILTLDKKD